MIYARICVVMLLVLSGFSASSASPGTSSSKKTPTACPSPTPPFTYDHGPSGQQNWCGECNDPNFEPQAPINITTPTTAQPEIQFKDYDKETSLRIADNNPYNLKVDYKSSSNPLAYIIIDSITYKLQEFHFHRPSEEAVNNRRSPMVLHLVHLKDGCKLGDPGCAVAISVLIEQGTPQDSTSTLLQTLFNNFPPPTGNRPDTISLQGLIPRDYAGDKNYWRFDGSLTTPPCTENVTFYVLKAKLMLSQEQLAEFERRYPLPNARDVQPLNNQQRNKKK